MESPTLHSRSTAAAPRRKRLTARRGTQLQLRAAVYTENEGENESERESREVR